MTERANRCETCRFWQVLTSDGMEGECRIRSVVDFPTRMYASWCGDWEPHATEPPADSAETWAEDEAEGPGV